MDKRKVTAASAAFLLALTAGCEDKKKPAPEPVTSEDTGDYMETVPAAPETPVFRELTDEEFTEITVPIKEVDKEPPVEVSYIDISGLDFGEKVPVCNRAEFAEDYYNFVYMQPIDNHYAERFIDQPAMGNPLNCCVYGGKCYIYVVYETFKGEIYDWAVFSYDMAGGKPEEIYTNAAEDMENGYEREVCFCDGSMLFTEYSSDMLRSSVKKLDLDTREVTQLYDEDSMDIAVRLDTDDTGAVVLMEYHNVSMEETVKYIYDSEKGEFVKDGEIKAPEGNIKSSDCFNGVYSYLIKPEGKRKYDLVNDYYRLSTSLTAGRIIYADEKLAVLYNNVKLHIYNFEKMEHCITDVSQLGKGMVVCDGMLFIGCRSNDYKMPVYCIIPELGITYPIVEKGIYSNIRKTADGISFNETRETYQEVTYNFTDENGEIQQGGYTYTSDVIVKVYNVKVK